ncbi:DUF58 domain-containing protein [Saxibacter everestensis]|uniref:DUF58 domain-containing protein n=1 Tax=Saxibacter everestensis TaxID=2909229 RepID=A0ABY8QRC7_9MICO|nr:DUF58 domain-containing protein [Brevibacteriaceae bacterium ZFBP1038]
MAITGRFVVLTALCAIPLALAPGWATAWLLLGGLAALIILDLLLAASPRGVAVQRTPPASVRLGQPASSTLTVRNASRRRLRATLRDAWPPSAGAENNRHSLSVRPGERRRFSTPMLPTRRGDRIAAAVTIRSFGPMRLAARQASVKVPARLRVLPPFTSRRHLPSKLARLRELDGRTSVMIRGAGTEFDSLRDYVIGDDVRSIDWRATARRQHVVVRTWRPERDRRVLIVVDTSRTSAGRVEGEPRLDASIDAALLLSALASKAGDRVEMIAIDRRVRARVQGATGNDLLPSMVNALAPIEPDLIEADWSTIASTITSSMNQRAFVVLLTPLESAAVIDGLLPVARQLSARHTVAVASVADPRIAEIQSQRDTLDETYAAASAERAALDRAAVTAALKNDGFEVIDESPDELPPKLADLYLALKAAGRL